MPPEAPVPNLLLLKDYLQLSPAQIKLIHSSLEKHKGSLDQKRHAAHLAHLVLEDALLDPSTTEAKLKELNELIGVAKLAEIIEAHALLKENAAVLSPEQAAQLRTALPVIKSLLRQFQPPRPGSPTGHPQPPELHQ
jgi:hypothetical protein